jgi:secondary thiamine-phosphate synthase enzyme
MNKGHPRRSMERFNLDVETDGNNDIVNLSPELGRRLRDKGDGIVNLFVVGSTAALTTLEYETGLVKHDLPNLLQKLIPDDARYEHEATWNDDNGHSHIRSALIGPTVTIPFAKGKLLTGEYQQVVLIDFDTRPRRRVIICTILP